MYHLSNVDACNNKSTAKGISRSVKEQQLKEDAYRRALFKPEDGIGEKLRVPKISQVNHRVYTMTQVRTGLTCLNDKLYQVKNGDNWCTYPFGHYKLDVE